MGRETGIEWTDATWNPIRGCSRVSQGCVNCYAERVAARFSKPGQAYEGLAEMRVIGEGTKNERSEPHWTGEVSFIDEHAGDPLRWRKPMRIFVNSMSDLFHERIPDSWIDDIFAVMALAPAHTFQILTKRPERMFAYLNSAGRRSEVAAAASIEAFDEWTLKGRSGKIPSNAKWDSKMLVNFAWPLPNVWLGVSVEDQKTADERIPLLLQTAAAVRFISYEPALGPVTLDHVWLPSHRNPPIYSKWKSGFHDEPNGGLHWVICGGESGIGARPMHPDWARTVRDQCKAAGVAFFFKQWGEWFPMTGENPATERGFGKYKETGNPDYVNEKGQELYDGFMRVGKKKAGALLDRKEYREFPAVQSFAK